MKNRLKKNLSASGQMIILLVLLTMVGLTVGLSLISRTITDIRMSSQIEQSNRAFSAAEAGIETALRVAEIDQPGVINLPGAEVDYKVSRLGKTDSAYILPFTPKNNIQTVWLIDHDENGNINLEKNYEEISHYPLNSHLEICFGSSTDTDNHPALVLSLYYIQENIYKVAKLAFDSDVTRANNFNKNIESGGDNYCDGNYLYRIQVTPTTDFSIPPLSTPLFLRILVLYDSTSLAVKPASGIQLNLQGKIINSLGKTDTGVVRKLQVIQGFATLPPLFDYSLFAENSN